MGGRELRKRRGLLHDLSRNHFHVLPNALHFMNFCKFNNFVIYILHILLSSGMGIGAHYNLTTVLCLGIKPESPSIFGCWHTSSSRFSPENETVKIWKRRGEEEEEKKNSLRPQSFPYKLWHFIKKRQWHYGNDPIEKRRESPVSCLTTTSMGHHYIWMPPCLPLITPENIFCSTCTRILETRRCKGYVIFHLYLDNFLFANPITVEAGAGASQKMIPFLLTLSWLVFSPFLRESNMFHRPWKCARSICSFYNLIFIYYFQIKTLYVERFPSRHFSSALTSFFKVLSPKIETIK